MAQEETAQPVCTLPNGCTLFRKPNGVGGHVYTSDEIGGGVVVWDTALVSESTLLAAVAEERRRDAWHAGYAAAVEAAVGAIEQVRAKRTEGVARGSALWLTAWSVTGDCSDAVKKLLEEPKA